MSAEERRERGVFFTPRALVERVLEAVAPLVPKGPLRIIDPACGAGAFLAVAAERWPRAELIGVELNELSAQQCRERVPRARVKVGDALMGALPERSGNAFELWIGNPPYNGTSPLLRSKDAWNTAVSWLPAGFKLPKGQSLREDFVFFMLKASTRLQQGPGALAF
ncbi:MAG TPA: N-6 DNA methylase, partial [Archangium sp.]